MEPDEPAFKFQQRDNAPWIVPIPGTRKLDRLEENLGSVSVVLTADDLREIEEAASKIKVQGARYPEDLMKLSGR